jgi:hypothetical protein
LVLRPHRNRPPTGPANPALAAQQDGFLREVDEALREQQMLEAAKRYGRLGALAVVLVLLAVGGYWWWDHSRQSVLGARGEELTLALDQFDAGQYDTAAAKLAPLAAKGGDGAQTAAQLLAAGVLAEQGKDAAAQQAFAAIAADAKAAQPFRDLATVREVSLGFDKMPPDSIVARLKPLAVPGNPWFGSAGELLGIAYMKQGRNDLAGPLFAAITRDKTVPETLCRRARQMAGLLGVDAIDDVNDAANGGSRCGAGDAGPAATQ